MSRRGENIYRRKDGRWEGRYIKGYLDGKVKYGYVYAKTYREVREKLLAKKHTDVEEKRNMVYQNIEKKVQEDYFEAVAYEWFASQKSQWKQSSIVKYKNILERYLVPTFSSNKISEITRAEVVDFRNTLLVSGGIRKVGLSPKTVTNILSVLKNIFSYASNTKGYVVTDIKGITVKQIQKPMRIFSRTEQHKLNVFLYKNLNLCNLGILICLYTGIRLGEICALKWEDISLDEQCLHIHRTMQRIPVGEEREKKTKVIISTPKSDCSIRKIPIPDKIFELLKGYQKEEDTYLLTGKICDYMEPRTMQNRFRSVVRKCELEKANFHALRHTFATRCVEIGFDVKSLSEILGHASVNITLNRYVHPSLELKKANMNKLSELFTVW